MNEWGLNPSTLSAVGSLGVLLAIVGFLSEMRQNNKSRNLEAIFHISDDMRQRWEHNWGRILRDEAPRLDLDARQIGEVGQQLTYMLNWLDWMGVLLKGKLMDKTVLFATLSSPIAQMLRVSAHQIQCDIDDPAKGPDWWGNALYLASQREIGVNIGTEADKLRRIWIGSEHPLEFPENFHDRLSQNWPEPREQLHAGGWETTRSLADELGIGPETRVLDLCCGEGGTAVWIAQTLGANVVGIDISAQAILSATARAEREGVGRRCHFVRGNMFALPFAMESFDVIIGQDPDGFAHAQRLFAFKECRLMLCPGGTLAFHHWIPGPGANKAVRDRFDHANVEAGYPSHAQVNADAYADAMEKASFKEVTVEDWSAVYLSHMSSIRDQAQRRGEEADPWTTVWLELAAEHPFGVMLSARRE